MTLKTTKFQFYTMEDTPKMFLKQMLETRHFECEAYREVLFRFSAQKTLEWTYLTFTFNKQMDPFRYLRKLRITTLIILTSLMVQIKRF